MRRHAGRVVALAAAVALSAGCAHYSLVEPQPRTVADRYVVEPQIRWSAATDGKWEVWTVDGPGLQAVQFLNGLEDGEPLFSRTEEQKRLRFKASMTPGEIAELLADALAASGAQKVAVAGVRPHRFGTADGFRCELTFLNSAGLEKQAIAAGAVVDARLYLIVYGGARLHYFAKHREHAERIIQSVRMK